MDEEQETLALHARRKKSSMKISCCFNTSNYHRRGGSFDISSILPSPSRRSPSSWIRSKTQDLPEIKGKCKNFISRKSGGGKHRRHSSAEFSYDPLSYSLNFEDNVVDDLVDLDQMPRSFSSRLPASPPRATIIASTPSSTGKTLSVSSAAASVLPASRASAVAEAMKNLQLSPVGNRRNNTTHEFHHIPRRSSDQFINARKTGDHQMAEMREKSHDQTAVAEAQSRNIERSTQRAAAVAEVRRNLEDVTPSRQVLVELY